MSKDCNCGDARMHAIAVESAVFQCLLNAEASGDENSHWFLQADKLETKFKTGHGQHYSLMTRKTP